MVQRYTFSGGIRLVPEMGLKGSAKDSYTLVIPSTDPRENQYLGAWYEELASGADWNNNKEMAVSIFKYLTNKFDENNGFERPGGRLSLNEALKQGKGQCKEKSAVFQIFAQILDLESLYVRGHKTVQGDKYRHAWNELRLGDKLYLVDVQNKLFLEPYEESLKEKGFVVGKNMVVFPDNYELSKEKQRYIDAR